MMTRKQFLRRAIEVSAATLGLTVLSGCSTGTPVPVPPSADARPGVEPGSGGSAGTGSGSGSNQLTRCEQDGTDVTIGDNHGHVLVVSASDVAARTQQTYQIQGTSNHGHTVTLTAADFAALEKDQAIMTTSSFDDDHDHSIMVACA